MSEGKTGILFFPVYLLKEWPAGAKSGKNLQYTKLLSSVSLLKNLTCN